MKNITLIFGLSYAWLSHAFQSVDINKASAEQIALLPGIGVKLAKNIVSFRQKNGSFGHDKDLLLVSGMRETHLKKASGLIIFHSERARKVAQEKSPKTDCIKLPQDPIIGLKALEEHVLRTLSLADTWEAAMIERTRRSSMLPKVSFAFDYDRDVDFRQKNIADPSGLKQSGNSIGVGLRAAFDLSELVFHKSELDITSLALKRLEKREKIIERIHALYFDYKQLRDSCLKPEEVKDHAKAKLELERIAAILDSMSNNAFSQFQKGAGL
jgi:competence ComEA-like helix-hairpin-helix protein